MRAIVPSTWSRGIVPKPRLPRALRRYQIRASRYQRDVSTRLTWGGIDFYHPDLANLARAGGKPGRDQFQAGSGVCESSDSTRVGLGNADVCDSQLAG